MSWKSFACVAALSFAVAPAFAAPSLTFVNNADGTGVFQITPDASLFPTPAGGSIAFEIEITGLSDGAIVSAAEDMTNFPNANPGNFLGGASTGLNFTGSSLTAAFGSNLFTTDTPVDALTIDFGGAATFDYLAVVAQANVGYPFPVQPDPPAAPVTITASVTAGSVAGDFNEDGRVDNGDLNLLLGDWGSATVPPEWTAPFTSPVDNDELNDLLGNWGFGTSVAVPEPASALILAAAGVALVGVRRNG